jgi:hypothetical protein
LGITHQKSHGGSYKQDNIIKSKIKNRKLNFKGNRILKDKIKRKQQKT